jgi:hypothetical protein
VVARFFRDRAGRIASRCEEQAGDGIRLRRCVKRSSDRRADIVVYDHAETSETIRRIRAVKALSL